VRPPRRTLSRRRLLAGAGVATAALALRPGRAAARLVDHIATSEEIPPLLPEIDHLVWVWRFDTDGKRDEIRDALAARRLGVMFKTHDGPRWMPDVGGRTDGGPARVAELAAFFEDAGIPFHAWCNVTGEEPVLEARMAAATLAAGARSLTLDLESGPGFWRGSRRDATTYVRELRRWQPSAWVKVAPDGRPWEMEEVPLDEFAAASDGFAPQTYWDYFRGPTNRRNYTRYGASLGPEGVTPAIVVEAAVDFLGRYGLPVYPIADGTSRSSLDWSEFISASLGQKVPSLSVWRYGVGQEWMWDLLSVSAPEFADRRLVRSVQARLAELRSRGRGRT
jgi:hypothetical protein